MTDAVETKEAMAIVTGKGFAILKSLLGRAF